MGVLCTEEQLEVKCESFQPYDTLVAYHQQNFDNASKHESTFKMRFFQVTNAFEFYIYCFVEHYSRIFTQPRVAMEANIGLDLVGAKQFARIKEILIESSQAELEGSTDDGEEAEVVDEKKQEEQLTKQMLDKYPVIIFKTHQKSKTFVKRRSHRKPKKKDGDTPEPATTPTDPDAAENQNNSSQDTQQPEESKEEAKVEEERVPYIGDYIYLPYLFSVVFPLKGGRFSPDLEKTILELPILNGLLDSKKSGSKRKGNMSESPQKKKTKTSKAKQEGSDEEPDEEDAPAQTNTDGTTASASEAMTPQLSNRTRGSGNNDEMEETSTTDGKAPGVDGNNDTDEDEDDENSEKTKDLILVDGFPFPFEDEFKGMTEEEVLEACRNKETPNWWMKRACFETPSDKMNADQLKRALDFARAHIHQQEDIIISYEEVSYDYLKWLIRLNYANNQVSERLANASQEGVSYLKNQKSENLKYVNDKKKLLKKKLPNIMLTQHVNNMKKINKLCYHYEARNDDYWHGQLANTLRYDLGMRLKGKVDPKKYHRFSNSDDEDEDGTEKIEEPSWDELFFDGIQEVDENALSAVPKSYMKSSLEKFLSDEESDDGGGKLPATDNLSHDESEDGSGKPSSKNDDVQESDETLSEGNGFDED